MGATVYKNRDFFTYSLSFAAIPAGQSQSSSLNIEQDSDFSWEKAAYMSDDGDTESSRSIPLATVQIQDLGSGRFLMNGPVAFSSLFGIGALPFILPDPKIFVARASFLVIIANYGAAQIDDLYLSFIGSKLFL